MANLARISTALSTVAAAAIVLMAGPASAGDPYGVASITLPTKDHPPIAMVVAGLQAGRYTLRGSDGISGGDDFDPNKPGFEKGNITRPNPPCGVEVSYWVEDPSGHKITLEPDAKTTVPC